MTNKFDTKIILRNYIYMRDSQAMLEFFQYTKGCPWYSQIFQQEMSPNHMHYWKSVNIRGILKYTDKIPM